MKKIFIATLCFVTLLTSFASALNDPSDYGPEAETDFESKQDAYMSGFEAGVEYSLEQSNDGNAYNQGYEEGYRDGYNANDSAPDNDIIDRSEIHSSESSSAADPINGKIETQKEAAKKQWYPGEADNIALYIIGAVGIVSLVVFVLAALRGK